MLGWTAGTVSLGCVLMGVSLLGRELVGDEHRLLRSRSSGPTASPALVLLRSAAAKIPNGTMIATPPMSPFSSTTPSRCPVESAADRRAFLQSRAAYLSTLDLWIVSHGGVGSNHLVNFLNTSAQLRVKWDQGLYQETCHFPWPLVTTVPVLYVVGELEAAAWSMHRRGFLTLNVPKMLWGWSDAAQERCPLTMADVATFNPADPFGIKGQLGAFVRHCPNLVVLRYPFTDASLRGALTTLGLARDRWGKMPPYPKGPPRTPVNRTDTVVESLLKAYGPLGAALRKSPPFFNLLNITAGLASVLAGPAHGAGAVGKSKPPSKALKKVKA
eukprot:m.28991 g.28991  ORF g.28991 m.28991 type:complete len:329 (+) comp6628_c0_seq1:184-1170(+)